LAPEDRRGSASPTPPTDDSGRLLQLDVRLLNPWAGERQEPWIRPVLPWLSRCVLLDGKQACGPRGPAPFPDEPPARAHAVPWPGEHVALARRLGIERAVVRSGGRLPAPVLGDAVDALRGAGIAWGLATDGVGLSDGQRMGDLLRRGMRHLEVSLDGTSLALASVEVLPPVPLVLDIAVTPESAGNLAELVGSISRRRDGHVAPIVLMFTRSDPPESDGAWRAAGAAEAARAIANAVVTASGHRLPAGFRNLPLCLMGGLERLAWEWWSRPYALDVDGCLSGGREIDGPACTGCAWRDRCPGLSEAYVARYGSGELCTVARTSAGLVAPPEGERAVEVGTVSDGQTAYFSPADLRAEMERGPHCRRLVLRGPEPLLHPHLPAIVAAAAGHAAEAWVETSGTLLTRQRAEVLRSYGLSGLRLSASPSGAILRVAKALAGLGLDVEPATLVRPGSRGSAADGQAPGDRRRGDREDPGRTSPRVRIAAPSLGSGPSATLLLSTKCNFRCEFCHFADHDLELPWAAAREGATRLLATGCREFHLSGGEPTHYAHLLPLVDLLAAAGARSVLETNGLRLADRGLVRTLRAAGVDTAMLSFHDHAGPDFARLVGVAHALPRVLAGFDNLVAEGFRVIVHHVLYARNVARFPEFVRFYAQRLSVPGRVSLHASSLLLLSPGLRAARSLVPRLESLRGPFEEGVAVAAQLGVALTHGGSGDGFPECVFGPGPHGSGRPPERWIRHPRDGELGFILAGSREAFPGLAPDGIESYDALFDHLPACAGCSRRGSCVGVQRAYVALHGAAEFRALR